MSKNICELCSSPARMFCESDQASLCWKCDEKVHGANFLVAKHSRTLLCRLCYSPTPWKASGPKVGPTVSVCYDCGKDEEDLGTSSSRSEIGEDGESPESESYDGEYYSDSEDYGDEGEEEEEDGENQVVPWSSLETAPASSPGGGGSSALSFSKRTRETFESEDEDGCCSSPNLNDKSVEPGLIRVQESHEDCASSVLNLLRQSKMRRTTSTGTTTTFTPSDKAVGRLKPTPGTGTAAIVEKLQRFQQEVVN